MDKPLFFLWHDALYNEDVYVTPRMILTALFGLGGGWLCASLVWIAFGPY